MKRRSKKRNFYCHCFPSIFKVLRPYSFLVCVSLHRFVTTNSSPTQNIHLQYQLLTIMSPEIDDVFVEREGVVDGEGIHTLILTQTHTHMQTHTQNIVKKNVKTLWHSSNLKGPHCIVSMICCCLLLLLLIHFIQSCWCCCLYVCLCFNLSWNPCIHSQ